MLEDFFDLVEKVGKGKKGNIAEPLKN